MLRDQDLARGTRNVQLGTEAFPVLDLGNGPPVLLLHGFPDSRRLWRYQVPSLLDAGLRVIAPDLRGFGDAPAPSAIGPYRMRNLIGDVTGLLRALDIDRVRVVGHDWGASLAWSVAMYVPQCVERLAVLSVGAPGSAGWQSLAQRERSWYFYFFQFESAAEAWLRHEDWRLMREWARNAPDLEHAIADLSRPGRLTAALNWYRANVAPKPPPAQAPSYPTVDVPVLGMWGEHDAYLTEAQMTGSAASVTGPWTYERVGNAGHWLMLDQPDAITTRLRAFLT